MSKTTSKTLEKRILSIIDSFSAGFNETKMHKKQADKMVKGIVEIIGYAIKTIAEKDENYPHEMKLKKFVNKLYSKLNGYEGVKV